MKNRLFLLLLILVVLGGMGFGISVYLKESNKTVIRSELSARSKEFIASQSGQQTGDWRSVELGKKRAGESDFDSNRLTVKNCYSLVVPFQVDDSRQNDPCVYYAILGSPRGNMTTNLRTVGFTKTEEAPDVTFRRGKKENYKEGSLQTKSGKVLVFADIKDGSGKTAFIMMDGKLFTVTLNIAAADDIQLRQMKKIIESVQLASSD
jgi:hypothetical protein